MEKEFDRDYLIDTLNLPEAALDKTLTGSYRWSNEYTIVFAAEDKFWQTTYREGATENQEEGPWDNQLTVLCYEVEQRPITVHFWARVGSPVK